MVDSRVNGKDLSLNSDFSTFLFGFVFACRRGRLPRFLSFGNDEATVEGKVLIILPMPSPTKSGYNIG